MHALFLASSMSIPVINEVVGRFDTSNQRGFMKYHRVLLSGLVLALLSMPAFAAASPTLVGVPVDFILFGITLLCVALFHHYTLPVAVTGLVTVIGYKWLFTGFKYGAGLAGFAAHMGHEWVTLTNLLGLLVGFAILARHFEKSHVPVLLPRYLPTDWKGGFVLLVMVFFLSSFLDNIAAALIGGAMAHQLFRGRVHIAYLAGIVAASNAGGAGSVVGDTTTTMMWIDGVAPPDVLHAYIASATALLFLSYFAAKKQQAYSPIIKHAHQHTHIDWARVSIVGAMLSLAIVTNVIVNNYYPDLADQFPFLGAAVWVVIGLTTKVRRHDWEIVPETVKSSIFLLSLVTIASMMPVESLPPASWHSALGLGFISSIFDNIPLTALALRQGGYDWGVLAYAVGFGGSMLWFGSSAGVALSSMYPEARSAVQWVKQGWFVIVAYVLGFTALMLLMGWHPHAPHKVLSTIEHAVVHTQ